MIAKKEGNVITIEFEEHRRIVALALFQHNTGQVIKFNDVPDGAEVQFSNENSEKTTNKIVKDSQVEIPDFLVAEGLEITAYIQYVSETSETTVKIISIPVEARVKQGEVVAPEDEQTFREELQGIMNETKEAAKEAADKVEVNRKCLDDMEKKSTDTIENITTVGEAQINAINDTAVSQIKAINGTAQAQIESINNVAKKNIESETNSIVQAAQGQIVGINQVANGQIDAINQKAALQIYAINDTANRQIYTLNQTATSQIKAINDTAQAQSKALQEQGDGLKYDLAVKEKHTIMLSAGAYSDLIDVNEYDAIQVNSISCGGTDTISEDLKLEVVKFKNGEQVGDEFLEKYNAIADLTDCDSIKLLVVYQGGISNVATVWYTLIVWDTKKEIERYVERVEDAVLIKPTASGTDIVIDDSSNMPIQELHLYGKSEQTATTGAQLFNVNDKLNWNSVFSVDDEDWISAIIPANAGTTDTYYAFNTKKSDLLKPSTTYLAVMELGTALGSNINIVGVSPNSYSGNRSQFQGYLNFTKTSTAICKTIDSFENSNVMCKGYIQVKPGFTGGSVKFRFSLIEDTSVTIDNFKYEPYTGGISSPNSEYQQEIKSVVNPIVSVAGKNILMPSIPNYSSNATITIQDRVENKIKIKVNKLSTTNTTYIVVTIPITRMIKKIKPNTKYTIILKNPSNITHTFIGLADGGNRITNTVKLTDNRVVLTTISDINNYSTKYPLIFYFTGSAIENATIGFDDIAVYEGECPNAEIEEYKPIQSATLNYTLNGIGDVKDELIVRSDGTGQIIRRNKEIILDEKAVNSRTSIIESKASFSDSVLVEIKGIKDASNYSQTNYKNILCNKLQAVGNIYANNIIGCGYTGTSNWIRLRLSSTIGTTIAEISSYLKDNPLEVLYVLNTPITTDLSAEEVQKILALHTNKPNTTIWNDKNADMQITYVADAKSYIDKKFKELSDAIVASASETE